MKLLGNVLNRLLVTSAKFEECSRSRKSYVKFSILGLFFWHTRYFPSNICLWNELPVNLISELKYDSFVKVSMR